MHQHKIYYTVSTWSKK